MNNSRRMIYPFTATAKIVQFPFKFYWNTAEDFRYTVISAILCVPIFKLIQDWSYSDSQIALRDKIRREHIEHVRDHIDSL